MLNTRVQSHTKLVHKKHLRENDLPNVTQISMQNLNVELYLIFDRFSFASRPRLFNRCLNISIFIQITDRRN